MVLPRGVPATGLRAPQQIAQSPAATPLLVHPGLLAPNPYGSSSKHPPLTAKIHDTNLVSLQPLSAQPHEAKDTQRALEVIAGGPGGVWGSMCHLSSRSPWHRSPAGAMGAQMLCSFSACKFSSRALALPSCGLRAPLLLAGDPWDTTMLSHIPLQAPTVMVLFQHYLL